MFTVSPTGRDRVRDRSWREERGRAEGRGQASRRSEGILSRESMEENGEKGERRQSETFVEDPQEVPRAGYYFEVRSTAINRHRVLYHLSFSFVVPNKSIFSGTIVLRNNVLMQCISIQHDDRDAPQPSQIRTNSDSRRQERRHQHSPERYTQ